MMLCLILAAGEDRSMVSNSKPGNREVVR